ncbi:MAG: hypothetical protein AAF206_20080 [Bacteroidota bacterium]
MPFPTRLCFLALLLCWACQTPQKTQQGASPAKLLQQYAAVPLAPDIAHLSPRQKRLVPLLIQAAQLMDDIFWREAYGTPDSVLLSTADPELRQLLEINYGPWNRLNGNQPIFPFLSPKPSGANFYPADFQRTDLRRLSEQDLAHPFMLIRKDEEGNFITIPYHEYFRAYHQQAASLLTQAASISENQAFSEYLRISGEALLNDQYSTSQYLWLDLKEPAIDFLIGPIETYEDELFGFKAAHQSLVMIRQGVRRDTDFILSEMDQIFAEVHQDFPRLQNNYQLPGSVEWYDLLYAAGLFNAGPKSVGINLPLNPSDFPNRGSRRILFRNLINAKFERILYPLATRFFPPDFPARPNLQVYQQLVLCHELAHSVGIWTVANGEQSVLDALKQHASTIEEAKASVLGFLILHHSQRIRPRFTQKQLQATYFTSLLRAVRFGRSSPHGQASSLILSYLRQQGVWDWQDGQLAFSEQNWQMPAKQCLQQLLYIQEQGLADKAAVWLEDAQSMFPKELSIALQKVDIPIDLRFEQGTSILSQLKD